jgi:hypothetical protein
VNLILVLDDVTPPILRALAPALAAWRKHGAEPPLLMSRAEWRRASDAFPIELTDMREGYEVLRGSDPLAEISVTPDDLRRALERELRGKLLRLRQGYAAAAGDAATLGAVARTSASTIMVLLRALLALLGRAVPVDPVELAREAAQAVGSADDGLTTVVAHRGEARWRCPPELFERYLAAVEQAARYVDQLQPGDR